MSEGKIKECQFIIPIPNQSYTDVRPVIMGESWEEIKTTALKIAEDVGNQKLVERLSGAEKTLTGPSTGLIREIGDGVLFNETEHTYSKNGLPYLSGSAFAHMFEKEFPKEAAAAKVAAKPDEIKTTEEVLAAWDMRGETSLMYGSLIHKCIELWNKYVELPKNEYLRAIVNDYAEGFLAIDNSEMFVQDDVHQLCGVIDAAEEHVDGSWTLYDWKTGDIHQKVQHTLGRDFPNDRLTLYTLQLNFYRYIMEQNGKKVKDMYIGWLNGEHWEKIKIDFIDIKPYLEQVWKPKKLSSN